MAKPSYRDFDENPRRGDDIKIGAFGVSLEANGKTVVGLILTLCALGALFYHDYQANQDHKQFVKQVQIFTYVLTADEAERKLIRQRLAIPDELKQAVREIEHEKAAREFANDERRNHPTK
jgi:hypothetical protein